MLGIVNSNTDGQYLFTELGNGTYIVTAIKFGYLPYERKMDRNLNSTGVLSQMCL